MAKYKILAPLTFGDGEISLTEAQAARRKHALTPLAKGRYKIVQPVQFKAGELIDYDGVLPKHMAAQVQAVSGVKAKD